MPDKISKRKTEEEINFPGIFPAQEDKFDLQAND